MRDVLSYIQNTLDGVSRVNKRLSHKIYGSRHFHEFSSILDERDRGVDGNAIYTVGNESARSP